MPTADFTEIKQQNGDAVPFRPLLADVAIAAAPPSLKILQQTSADLNFVPVVSRLAAAPPKSAEGAGSAACEPKVSLERDGDRVTQIHIQCSCGQSIQLACLY